MRENFNKFDSNLLNFPFFVNAILKPMYNQFLNQARSGHRLPRAWFLEITFNVQVYVCVRP